MAKKSAKVLLIALNAVQIPTWENDVMGRRNVRVSTAALESVSLQNDLATFGQQVPADMELVRHGDKEIYIPIRGHRRAWNLKRLAERGIIDPSTCKKDENGRPILETGKPFTHMQAWVYENLTPLERAEMLTDHSQVRGLDKVELFNSFCMLFDVRMSEREITVKLFDLLLNYYPPSRKVTKPEEDHGKDALANYKGVVQTMKAAWRAPKPLQEAYIDKLRGEHGSWPTNSEIAKYCDIYETEREKNPGSIDRENPGPIFMEAWNAYVKKQAEAVAQGKTRGKSESMMSRQSLEDVNKTTDSALFRYYNMFVRREVDPATFPVADKIAKKAYNALSDEDKAMFLACFPANAPTDPGKDTKVPNPAPQGVPQGTEAPPAEAPPAEVKA